MRTIAVKVGELYALLKLDKQQFDKALKDASNGLDNLAKKADKLVKVGENLTKWVTTPILGIAGASVKMASDVEQASGKFNVAFGQMADVARETLDQLAEDMQRSRFEMQAMAADAQAILAPMVQNRELAAQMSVALSTLAVDLAGYNNIADSDAHQRLISGLLGSTEATERLGISLRDTTLQLEAERLGIEANVAQLDDATKIRLRFIAILRQSVDAQGDAIRSSASFESQMRALRADLHELSVTLGQELLPYALAGVQWARDLAASLKQLSPEAKETIIQFGMIAATAGPLVFGLGKVTQGIVATSRALLALTRLARTNPYMLLGMAAAGLLLTMDEVQERIDQVFRSLGMGAPFEFLDDLGNALSELESLVSRIEFDPAAAQEDAMERLRQVYRDTLEQLERDVQNGFGAVAESAEEGLKRLEQTLQSAERSVLRRELLARTGAATAEGARALAELSILGMGLTGDEAERVRLQTELDIRQAELAVAERRLSLIKEEIRQQEQLRNELQRQLDLTSSGFEDLDVDVAKAAAQINEINDVVLTNLHQQLQEAQDEVQTLFYLASVTATELNRLGEARLQQIRENLSYRLGVGLGVEREISLATGVEFDALAFEVDALRQAVQDMAQATGEITPEMEEWLERLRELGIAIEQRTTQERAAEAAVESLKDALFAGNQAMRQFVDDLAVAVTGKGTASGLFAQIGTAIAPGVGTAIGAAADLIFAGIRTDAAERASRLLEEAADAIRSAAHEWQGTLAESQFHELLGATPDVSRMEEARQRILREIRAIERWGVWPWEQENLRKLQDQLEDINAEINRILQEAPGEVMDRLEEILGVTIRDLQGAVSGAFSASTAEDFAANIESALEGRVRNAFVTAFLESATMAPLFETLGDAIREALLDIDISPDEMRGIRAIMDEIKDRSTPLYDLLDEMGLLAESTERVNREFARLVNVPLVARALNALRFEAQEPVVVPALAEGGIVTRPTLALIGERGPEAVVPLRGGAGSGGDIIIQNLNLPGVTNAEQFIRELREQQRMDSLRRTGNPTALQRVGR